MFYEDVQVFRTCCCLITLHCDGLWQSVISSGFLDIHINLLNIAMKHVKHVNYKYFMIFKKCLLNEDCRFALE